MEQRVVRQLLPLATSVVTLIGMWMVGNKNPLGWLVGLGNQTLWGWFIVAFHAWGLLPLSCALSVVYSRNLLRWRRDAIKVAS